MTPERWHCVKEIFHRAIHLVPDLRAAYVQEAAGGDVDLAAEVLSLLQVDTEHSDLRNPFAESLPETAPLSTPGQTVGGRLGSYRLIEEIGRGGMGVVYRGYDESNRRFVAVKTLYHETALSLHLFKREFRGFADLTHPNLVTLYELFSDGSRWCFSMELVEGKSFIAHLADHPEHLRDSLRQLGVGVAALHRAGKIHRDLKPSNVRITPHGRVVILDFGIARELGTESRTTGQNFGTPAYLAPEQAEGRDATSASDWYSVGIILFEALTGTLPFDGPQLSVLQAKLSRDAPHPQSLNSAAPEDLSDLCLRLLRRNPEERPQAEQILALLGAVADHSITNIRASAPEGHFVGREKELSALRDAFDISRQGDPCVVHLRGRSGAGKTALVRQFLKTLDGMGAVVLAGHCHEQEFVPFKAFDSVIDSLVAYLRKLPPLELHALLPRDIGTLGRLFPAFHRVPAIEDSRPARSVDVSMPELRRRAGAALRDLLGKIGDRHPLILFIDDIHWGDADSASLLIDLLTPPEAAIFLCIVAYRSEDSGESSFLSTLREMRRQAVTFVERYVELGELSFEETRNLAVSLLNLKTEVPSQTVDAVVAESSGRPLLVYDLIEHLAERTSAAESDTHFSLSDSLWGRIQKLSKEAADFVKTIAVFGRPVEIALANLAAGTSVDETVLRTLSAGRLLRRTPGNRNQRFDLYHDRVRLAVMEHLSPSELSQKHRQWAAALRDQPEQDAERIAFHLHHSGSAEEAAEFYSQAAGKAADALSFEQAARLYRQALRLKSWGQQAECRIRTGLADALHYAGRAAEAAQEYVAASLQAATEDRKIDLQHHAALALLTAGHVDEGMARLRPVLKSAGLRLARAPWSALLSLLFNRLRLKLRGTDFIERPKESADPETLRRINIGWSVVIGLSIIDPIRGADFQTRSLLLALRAGEPFCVARALAVEAAHLASSAQITEARRALQTAQRLSESLRSPYATAVCELARGTIAYFCEEWLESLTACRNAVQLFEQNCSGVTWEVDTGNAFCLWSLAKMGEIFELSRYSPALLKDAHERGDLYAVANLSTQIMAMVRLGTDEPELARATLTEVMSQWSQSGYHVQHHDALLAFVPLELYSGNPEAAWSRIQSEWAAFRWSLLSHVQDLRVEMLQLRAYCALAMTTVRSIVWPFLNVASRDARRLRREKLPWTSSLADYIEGAVAQQSGQPAQAREKLACAIEGFDRLRAGLHAAATRMRLAELDTGNSRLLETQALEWCAQQRIKAPDRLLPAFAPGFRFQISNASNLLEIPPEDRRSGAAGASH